MTFLVTGGSRGIGRGIVLDAAVAGHDVAFTYATVTNPETAFPNAAFWNHYATGEAGVEIIDDFTVRECGAAACPADVDGNQQVDVSDLLAVLLSWGPCAGCPEDVDGDGVVGVGDLVLTIAAWGPCPP